MTCVYCKVGQTFPKHVPVVLEIDRILLVFRHLPAEVCGNCGHQYYSSEVTQQLLTAYEEALRKNTEVEVVYAAAQTGIQGLLPMHFKRLVSLHTKGNFRS